MIKDQADILVEWKQAYYYLDRNWGSELIKSKLSNQAIIALFEKARRYRDYLEHREQRGLKSATNVSIGIIDEIIQSGPNQNPG